MLESPLTLVLGAGSSRDFGPSESEPFPLGDDLRNKLAACLGISRDEFQSHLHRGSSRIYNAYKIASEKISEKKFFVDDFLSGGQEIVRALPGCESIDDFLERHPGNSRYEIPAKLGIAECILGAERSSPLRQEVNRTNVASIEKFNNHWLAKLLVNLTKKCREDHELELVFSKLKVVNFNYDRCFEWFCYIWLRNVYHISEDRAVRIIRHMHVIHPYGSLGSLFDDGNNTTPFGIEPSPLGLFDISRNILTYSESINRENNIDQISIMTSGCSNFVFFGFAFHPQNMEFFTCNNLGADKTFFCTTVDIPIPRWQNIASNLLSQFGLSGNWRDIHTSPNSCSDLVSYYVDRWV